MIRKVLFALLLGQSIELAWSSDFVPPNPEPLNPPAGYFNYDPNSSYGPDFWDQVDTRDHWLKEFGPRGTGGWQGNVDYDPSENMCGRPIRKQSPKDLKGTIACEAGHEIRTWCGFYGVSSDSYDAKILSHKLSLIMNRRPCLQIESNSRCRFQEPPRADYPRYASAGTSYADVMHYDIKVPSEHTIDGLRFYAEIQIFHVHPVGGRLSSVGILIDASDTPNAFNPEFQDILEEFQDTYDSNARVCERRRTRARLEETFEEIFEDQIDDESRHEFDELVLEYAEVFDGGIPDEIRRELLRLNLRSSSEFFKELQELFSKYLEEFETLVDRAATPTRSPTQKPTPSPTQPTQTVSTNQERKFDPYSDALFPTIFFYRYDGSITEPPCKDITWWVMSEPLKIAAGQLTQLQHLLFTNVDPDNNCLPSSVHNVDQSVARPTFGLGQDRDIQACLAGSFRSDFDKRGSDARKCRL